MPCLRLGLFLYLSIYEKIHYINEEIQKKMISGMHRMYAQTFINDSDKNYDLNLNKEKKTVWHQFGILYNYRQHHNGALYLKKRIS